MVLKIEAGKHLHTIDGEPDSPALSLLCDPFDMNVQWVRPPPSAGFNAGRLAVVNRVKVECCCGLRQALVLNHLINGKHLAVYECESHRYIWVTLAPDAEDT